MLRKNRLSGRIYLATYDKISLNKKALRLKKSLDELERLLEGREKSKTPNTKSRS